MVWLLEGVETGPAKTGMFQNHSVSFQKRRPFWASARFSGPAAADKKRRYGGTSVQQGRHCRVPPLAPVQVNQLPSLYQISMFAADRRAALS
jgi:hypothetical protein